ncbi:MAG: penicillin-binding protein 2 [Thermoflavifilum sp.]|uniref:penicillin-binding protein 2 n=1 Tax=Thermoflavifilum sp. TaxID=1968839 RepID=UPI0018A47297|nr:penicillin-binding protein 2 [Thermoflavifilum sp.]QOR75078.1 MAG: penicillin-binding protein 2 [Thermoflavifilum sp.]
MAEFHQPRRKIIQLIFVAVFAVIAARLFYLQVVEKKYRQLANAQAIVRKLIYPTRGIIYDRHGRVVVNNTALYDLMVTPAEVKHLDTGFLCELLGIDTATFRERMEKIILRNSRYRQSVFAELLPPDIYGRIEENLYQFPGFELVERPVRNYPYHAGAHIFGYIGEVDSATIKRSQGFYQPGDFIGKTGLERSYENILRGQRGVAYLVRDSRNRIQGSYAGGMYDTPAVAGRSLYLSLDMELQQLGEQLLQNKIGSIVAIDPNTGGILAMVSSPTYDPNELSGAERNKKFSRLFTNPELPLFNRPIQATYPPGSTFKPVDALIALHEGVITPQYGYDCRGVYLGCGRPIRCTESFPGHASNLYNAIAYSCNSYFSQVFRFIVDKERRPALGLVEWHRYVSDFGLGKKLGIDLPGEYSGYIPDTAHYNKIFGRGRWNSCTIVSLGIGQGEITETPLQLANVMCIIANHGYYYTPHVVDSVEGDPDFYRRHLVLHRIAANVSDTDYDIVTRAMAAVVERGTATIAAIPGITICGKTGTAQNFTIINGKRVALKDHSLFAAFAPREHPRIAIAVVVENAGFGASWAAPIGSLMIEKYLRDSIATDRLPLLNRITQANLIPEYILEKKRRIDSLNQIRDKAEARHTAMR